MPHPLRLEKDMSFTTPAANLTDEAVLTLLDAAQQKAHAIGAPQCIVVVDASGVELGSLRMRGAKFLSLRSAKAKAQTAASTGARSDKVAEGMRIAIAAATDGAVTGLAGGLPIRMGGMLVGGIGIGSGSGAQDIEVAEAALAAIGAEG
jgi:uncharacterized protein GlcG (DUF336 family)